MTIKRRTHRRSGNAVVELAQALGWTPRLIIQVGVGSMSKEVEVFQEEWPGTFLIGFEPNPDSFTALKKTYPGTLVQKAVGSCSSEHVPFYSKQGHDNGSSLLRVGEDKTKLKEFSVSMIALDRHMFLTKPRNNTLLWLDCEGTELQALYGAGIFLRQVGMVNVEMTGTRPAEGWSNPEDVDNLLRNAGFYQTWVHTIRTKLGQRDAVYVRGDLFKPEFCCCPGEIRRWREDHK